MTRARLGTTALFSLLYVVAALIGRQSVVPGSTLALVWPAAGVVAVWFATLGWSRTLLVDVVVLFAVATGVNTATGANLWLGLSLGWAAVVQALVFGVLLSRSSPHLWGRLDESSGLRRLVDVGHVLTATVVSTVASALVGPAVVLSVVEGNALIAVSWVVRNSVSVLALLPFGVFLVIRFLTIRTADQHAATNARSTPRVHAMAGDAELVAVFAASGVVCWLVLIVNHDLPLPFLLIGTSVWVGTRLTTATASVHSLLIGSAVVVLTLDDYGPFAEIVAPVSRSLVVQAFVGLTVITAMALAIGREESGRLNQRLARAEDRSSRQATMLTTILDSLADGVSVLRPDGTVVLRNPAATRLTSGVAAATNRTATVAQYGMFHPDGRPLAPQESPFAQAVAGTEITAMELFIRNAGVPEGQLIEVSVKLLADGDEDLVVGVFHDVTSDRRERDELASFAGVVAHDLLNPLTTVEGWSEALAEEIREPGVRDPEVELEHLTRIQRAARRMRDLINDLLAYTTARDLQISPVRVDLGAVVQDVARSRTEMVSGREVAPVITIGELPDVLAEPVLLRQVIDNLIGNSVKYVAPGVTPEITVQARESDGLVEIVISDNGIGIPDGQHTTVFDTFHRAHTDGYRGTGLGLSIVKRVVERHGGTITASHNPDHPGTVMRLTFPAVSGH